MLRLVDYEELNFGAFLRGLEESEEFLDVFIVIRGSESSIYQNIYHMVRWL